MVRVVKNVLWQTYLDFFGIRLSFSPFLLIPLPLSPFWPRVSIGREIYFPPLPLFSQVKLSTSKKEGGRVRHGGGGFFLLFGTL